MSAERRLDHILQHSVIDESELLARVAKDLMTFPEPTDQVLPGVTWGDCNRLFTPAYWKLQYLFYEEDSRFTIDYRLGENLFEEVVACLLGGFGLKAEIGLAAFRRLREQNLIRRYITPGKIVESLTEPLSVGEKRIRYRFPNQKAKYIAAFLNRDDLDIIPTADDHSLRAWLLSVSGIGPKTASWITRNYLDSEKVAIIDVHIVKACIYMGLFPKDLDIVNDYFILEKTFLLFCERLCVNPSRMDALMWLQMKESGAILSKK